MCGSRRYRFQLSFYRRLSIRELSILAKLSIGLQKSDEEGRLAFCDRKICAALQPALIWSVRYKENRHQTESEL